MELDEGTETPGGNSNEVSAGLSPQEHRLRTAGLEPVGVWLEEELVNYRRSGKNDPRVRDITGHLPSKDYSSIEMGEYGTDSAYPGPDNEGLFDVQEVYSLELVANQLFFGVWWKNWLQIFNTLEPIDSFIGSPSLTNFASKFVNLCVGSVSDKKRLRKSGKRSGNSFNLTSFDGLTQLTKPEDIEHGDHELLENAYRLLRGYVANNKFYLFLGFFS